MRLNIIAVGNKMPTWVTTAFKEFEKRFFSEFPLTLIEIPANKRVRSSTVLRLKEEEGQKILASLAPRTMTIALDERGTLMDTQALAKQIERFQSKVAALNFVIGGPDGLSEQCLSKADMRWSLSPLTLPHPLVRIILIEQLYRAISILKNHPYHRA